MNNRLIIFKRFLDSFETESMRSYCEDLLVITPSDFWCWATITYDCPGGLIMQTLEGCNLCDSFLRLDEFKESYPMPKMRDSIRIAVCFRYINKTDWIRNTKVTHDIKQKLKDYIANQIDSFKKCTNFEYQKNPNALICFCDYLSVKVPLNPNIKTLIRQEALPDPELYFFKEGKYENMNFWLVYQMDKEYLYELRNSGEFIQEPLRTYLKEYL